VHGALPGVRSVGRSMAVYAVGAAAVPRRRRRHGLCGDAGRPVIGLGANG
jgi:hypothetical protein